MAMPYYSRCSFSNLFGIGSEPGDGVLPEGLVGYMQVNRKEKKGYKVPLSIPTPKEEGRKANFLSW